MGKRSRKRSTTPAPVQTEARPGPSKTAPRPPDRRARREEAPPAPWSPIPLTELCILISLILMGVALTQEGSGRSTTLGAGIALLTLASGELAFREHFAGYRSHSGLLSAIVAIIVAAPIYLFTSVPPEVILGVSVIVFGIAFKQLRDAFAARAGGLKFRA